MFDIQSIIIYVGLPLVCFFIAKYAETFNSKKAVWVVVMLFSLIAGMRAVSVGIDTKTYDAVFSFVSSGGLKSIYGIENSFIYICAGLLHIWENNHFLFFAFALVSHGLIIFRIWQDREAISFRWSILFYYVVFFAFSLNGLRQFVAVAIVFFATSFVKKGEYIKFAVIVLLATLFHTSAIVGLGYLFFEIVYTKYFDAKRKLYIFLFLCVGGAVALAVIPGIINQYFDYFSRAAASLGFMMIAKFIMLVLSSRVLESASDEDQKYYCSSLRWNYFVGLLLNSLSYVFLYAGRVGMYFYIFEPIYIGYLFKTKNKTLWVLLFKIGYALLMLYNFYITLKSSANGEIPYLFFWQS